MSRGGVLKFRRGGGNWLQLVDGTMKKRKMEFIWNWVFGVILYHVKLGLNQKLLPTDKSFIATDASSAAPDDSSVATEGLPIGYILQYQTKLGKNQKLVTTDAPFITTYELSAAPDDSYVATNGLPVEYMLQYQAKLGQNQKFVQTSKAYNKVEFYDHFNQIRDMVPKTAEHLESVGFHRWSRAFCPENRYNIMTSNITESVNAMFEVEREFPIVVLFDEINMRFAKLFHERRMELVNSANILVPSMEKQISKNINLGNKLLAH
ncbi:hypothetical protein KY289_024586 [Solanum tuberosum]|nr:hypothetical protein KY289_024586 [Solanum tuberosum]